MRRRNSRVDKQVAVAVFALAGFLFLAVFALCCVVPFALGAAP